MQDFDSGEKFDIRKLPRLEISKPIDVMMRWLLLLFFVVVPVGVLIRGTVDGRVTPLNALIAGVVYGAIVTALYHGVKRYFVLDRTRKGLFRVTRIFGSLSETYICGLADIACVTVDSLERTTKGGSTGQFWYESCLVLKNSKIIRLHRTFEDSYDEIQDAEQYAQYLGVKFFGPKPGFAMKVVKDADGSTLVEFSR